MPGPRLRAHPRQPATQGEPAATTSILVFILTVLLVGPAAYRLGRATRSAK